MIDLEKLKNEIKELDELIVKALAEYWELIGNKKKGVSKENKIKINQKITEVTKLKIDRDKKVHLYHNYFNPFKVIILFLFLFGGIFALNTSSNFEVNQTELAMSELFSNHSGGYIRNLQETRVGVYIEPKAGTSLNEVKFLINGCGLVNDSSTGVVGEEPNIIYSGVILPNMTLSTTHSGLNEKCTLTVKVSVIDSDYFNYEKTMTYNVGNVLTGCEYSKDCNLTSAVNARGYYYYDNIYSNSTININLSSDIRRGGYAYFVTKGTFISNGTITGSGSNGAVCGSTPDGQKGAILMVWSPYIYINTVTIDGGDGKVCADADGGYGGSGGQLYLYSTYKTILAGNIQMNGGAGTAGGSVASGEDGWYGGGGAQSGYLVLSSYNSSIKTIVERTGGTITLKGGNGGAGSKGNNDADCSDGGSGGEGGSLNDIGVSHINIFHFGGSTVTKTSGNGGNAGDADAAAGSCYGGDGGDAGAVNIFSSLTNSNINITATINVNGGNGGAGGDSDEAVGGNGGNADDIDIDIYSQGDYYQSSKITIQMGNGGAAGTGSSSGDVGCKGGCRWSSDANGPSFSIYGKVLLTNDLKCTPGASGETTDCYSATANWEYRINTTQVLVGNDFTKLLPARVNGTEVVSIQQIGYYSNLSIENLTIRKNNFSSSIYDMVQAENTTENRFILFNSSSNLPILELTEEQSFSGFIPGTYYIYLIQCGGDANRKYCTSNSSNNFTISKIPTNITGYTDPSNLTNITIVNFDIFCQYNTSSPDINIIQANVVVTLNGTTEQMEYVDGEYYYENDNYYASNTEYLLSCTANKRDFEVASINITNVTFTPIVVELPYGNPMSVCLYPNQKNVEPLYQNPAKYVIRVINLYNETINLSASFNYPLPSSIVQGMKIDTFNYNWSQFILLNTSLQTIKENMNYYDGTQNVSNYSTKVWLLTNCTDANPGTDILNYTGDYVFKRDE